MQNRKKKKDKPLNFIFKFDALRMIRSYCAFKVFS